MMLLFRIVLVSTIASEGQRHEVVGREVGIHTTWS